MAHVRPNLLGRELARQLKAHPENVSAIVRQLINVAMKGDIKAIQMIFDRDSGRVKEEIEVTATRFDDMTDDELAKQVKSKLQETIRDKFVNVSVKPEKPKDATASE